MPTTTHPKCVEFCGVHEALSGLWMKFGILSDVHSNLEALEVALAFLREADVDEIVFLGDAMFAYRGWR